MANINLYDMGARVVYGDFVSAASNFIRTLLKANGERFHNPANELVRVMVKDQPSASINLVRYLDAINFMDVYLPAIDPEKTVSGTYARNLLGLLIHETLHALRSNAEQLGQALTNAGPARELVNVLEDYYIERQGSRPGTALTDAAAEILGDLNDVFQAGSVDMAREASSKGDQLAQATALVSASMNRHGFQGSALGDVQREVEGVVHTKVFGLVGQALNALDAMSESIRDAKADRIAQPDRIAIYRDLISKLMRMPQEQPEQQQQQQQQQGGEKKQQGDDGKGGKPDKPDKQQKGDKGDKGEGKAENGGGEGEGETEGDEQGEGEGEGEGDEQGQGEGQPGADGQAESSGEGRSSAQPEGSKGGTGASLGKPGSVSAKTDEQRTAEMLERGAPAMTAEQKAVAGDLMRAVANGDLDKPAKDAEEYDLKGQTTLHAQRAADAANARQFADSARRALRAEDTTTTAHRLQTGRLDRRAIARASMGALDVMTRRMMSEGIRTAVVVMVDMSSSMDDTCKVSGMRMSRMDAVAGAASVIVPAIERAGAEVAVYGFTTAAEHPNRVAALKPWNKRLPTTQEAIKGEALGGLVASGGTPMVAPMLYAEHQLKQRRVTRRVVVWLCDGQPSGHEMATLRERFAKKRQPIEHVGIGLDCSLGDLFPEGKHVEVHDMGQLAKAFETLLIPKAGARA